MQLRRVAMNQAGNPTRRQFSSTTRPKTMQAEASLQWVTARVPPDLVREIEAHAKRSGTTRSEAIRECLAVGIETIHHREGVPGGRIEELLGAIESVRLLLELVGPPTLGTQRLLAHWASRDGAVKVSEDELLAEVRVVSADEWEQAVAEAERDLSRPRIAGPHDEKA
jgi:Ribbon-helix-helix protein, copG family